MSTGNIRYLGFVLCLIFFACGNPVEILGESSGPVAGMEFASIPSGSFQMGATADEVGSESNERPVHTVTFSYQFEMMTTEVTQEMWNEVMGTNPSHFSGADKPVEMVSWNDYQAFIEEVNNRDSDYIYRLPSESEWEYACRAGTTSRFYWGDDFSETIIDGNAWWSGNSGETTHSVAQKSPNLWGLYDMNGNVSEWCDDWAHSDYNGAPTDGSSWLYPVTSFRTFRGGGWLTNANYCRSANRLNNFTEEESFYLGFRLVRTQISE